MALAGLSPTTDFFEQDIVVLAKALLGCTILVEGVGGRIVETEAYDLTDPASHSFNGPTMRNAAMFGPPGRAYIYRIYGAHWCFNIVGGEGRGAAVLIRALEPTDGLEIMRARRGVQDTRRLCAGPGRLCRALGISAALNGAPLDKAPFGFALSKTQVDVLAGPRVGITKAADHPWRFGERASPFLSRPFPSAP